MAIVDKVLAGYGLKFELNPYRIVDAKGETVQNGPSFDIRPAALKRCIVALEKRRSNQFKAS